MRIDRVHHYDTRDLSVLAAMGDSITADRPADGTQMSDTYCVKTASARGYGRFVNAGVPGDTTAKMLARFRTDVLNARPGCVSIMGGTNDVSSNISGSTWVGGGITAATTKANLKSMVLQAQALGARVTLCTPLIWRLQAALDNFGPYLTAMSEIVSETGCDFMDVYSRFLSLSSATLDTLYLSDGVHPNVAGHAYIAGMASEAGYVNTTFLQPTPV